jgi:hypothetical protein
MNPDNDWNPSTAAVLCLGIAALYQTCQSLAWVWSLVTGGTQ